MTNHNSCAPSTISYPSDCEVTAGLLAKSRERGVTGGRSYMWRGCLPIAKKIKLLLLDVDGVLTDGTITYSDAGIEIKSFNSKDGFGIRLLREAGVEVGLITARNSEAVRCRAADLGLIHVYQGAGNKLEPYDEIMAKLDLAPHEAAYMGDDWLDLPLLVRVGLPVTVADAVAEVKDAARYVTHNAGGCGAVRELCDLILEARGVRQSLLAKYKQLPASKMSPGV